MFFLSSHSLEPQVTVLTFLEVSALHKWSGNNNYVNLKPCKNILVFQQNNLPFADILELQADVFVLTVSEAKYCVTKTFRGK